MNGSDHYICMYVCVKDDEYQQKLAQQAQERMRIRKEKERLRAALAKSAG